MADRVYGYARVSTREQNLDRQMDALSAFGVEEEGMFADKASGKDFARVAKVEDDGDTIFDSMRQPPEGVSRRRLRDGVHVGLRATSAKHLTVHRRIRRCAGACLIGSDVSVPKMTEMRIALCYVAVSTCPRAGLAIAKLNI